VVDRLLDGVKSSSLSGPKSEGLGIEEFRTAVMKKGIEQIKISREIFFSELIQIALSAHIADRP
jgi:hypothetical protein